jgi:predicted dehydrogenase/threonine dehydrogenase-like Zn-dependent dehydrogenase
MKQLTQQLKSGKMEVLEVPFPALNPGYIMVHNHFSIISAGTEGKTVSDARKGYLAKARSRQKEVKQVIELIKSEGLLQTHKFVMNRLNAPSALGYSCAGEVIAVGDGVTNISVGDYVACGGDGAFHADVVSIPRNLVVKVPDTVDLKQAAFSTLAGIAIQGIRQTECTIGENCLIIGMGLLGQITYKILEASGVRPIGIDVSETQVNQSREAGLSRVYNRNMEGLDALILGHSDGAGADSVIITAATTSIDPVDYAGEMARQKAKIVIVGAVPTGFSRSNYYKKELDIRMSFSYGPGRSDFSYEERGIDYPIGYVRWTENRNMKFYIEMLASNRIDMSNLISHTFPLDKAPAAYDMILSKGQPFSGIAIEYSQSRKPVSSVHLSDRRFPPSDVNIGCIGAGNFAQSSILPNLDKHCNLIGIATGNGNTAIYVGEKYHFNYLGSADQLLADSNINTVIITTRHNLHADYVLKSINSEKHIYVEKPLSINEDQLLEINAKYKDSKQKNLMVGFNRRFAPAVKDLKNILTPNQTVSVNIRVNAGVVPVDHWVNDPIIGGGRIVGEGCHFIDLAMFLAGSFITTVSADSMKDSQGLVNTVIVNLGMMNGSIASINYFSNGNRHVSKEWIEVFSNGTIAQIDDYKTLRIFGKKQKTITYKGQDKGHTASVNEFISSIADGESCPIPFEESFVSMLATFKVNESIISNRKIIL